MERSEQELVRIEKLDKIREYCNPYPDKYDRTHTLKEARLLPDVLVMLELLVELFL